MGRHIIGQHKYFEIATGPRDIRETSNLDSALTKLKARGEKVLDFWRDGKIWIIKVMA